MTTPLARPAGERPTAPAPAARAVEPAPPRPTPRTSATVAPPRERRQSSDLGDELSSSERTMIQRLRWIIRLHWVAGSFCYLLTVVLWAATPPPYPLATMTIVITIVFGYTAGAAFVVDRWRRITDSLAVVQRGLLLFFTAADLAGLTAATHVVGGAHGPGLAVLVIPVIACGSFLPKRDAYLCASFGITLLGAAFAAVEIGWLAPACPPLAGPACGRPNIPLVLSRFLSTSSAMLITTYLASFIGTGLRRQEEGARRLAEARGHLVEMKSRLVATASHEFRTPLAVIRAAADTLERHRSQMNDCQQRERLGKIQSQVELMTGLIDDVLVLGRNEAAAARCTPEPIDLIAMCRAIVDEATATPLDAGRIALDVGSTVGRTSLDPRLVRQILTNLLSNALKYSAAGTSVTLAVTRRDRQVVFCVADHGRGMSAEDRDRIFEPFHRAADAADTPGTGLGMAVVRAAVELHGGTIGIESALGAGTRVYVSLPCE